MAQTPGPDARYRCGTCGNLTRFDVEIRKRARQFWHYTLAGDPSVEDEEVLEEEVLRVTCRWCGSADAVAVVPKVAAE